MESISTAELARSPFGAVSGGGRGRGRALPTLHADRERARPRGRRPRRQARDGALALIGLARELDAELAAWHADVADARARLAKQR